MISNIFIFYLSLAPEMHLLYFTALWALDALLWLVALSGMGEQMVSIEQNDDESEYWQVHAW